MMAPTGTGNGVTLADASDRAKGIDRGQLLDCLREGSSLPGVSRLLSGDVPDDIEGLEGELNDMFGSLPPEMQNALIQMQMNANGPDGRELYLRDAAFRCLEFETPAVRSAVQSHMIKNFNNPGNQRPEQLRADLFKLLAEVKAKPETVRVFEALVTAMGSSENQERDSAAMDVLENPNVAAEDDDDSSGPPSLAPSDDDDDDPRRSIRKEDEKNDSSAPPSLASSSGSDDDEDDRARTKVSDENKNKTPLLPEHVPEKGKGRVPLDATPASDSSSQPPSLASSPESSPAASPRASRVPSEAHIAGGSGSGTRPSTPKPRPPRRSTRFSIRARRRQKRRRRKKKEAPKRTNTKKNASTIPRRLRFRNRFRKPKRNRNETPAKSTSASPPRFRSRASSRARAWRRRARHTHR
jgi:hypothetical protein